MLAVSASAATAGTLSYDGDALVFTGGDNLTHEVQFRYDPATARDHVIDTQAITAAPGDCTYEFSTTWISCPGSLSVRVELGGGNDTVGFDQGNTLEGDCFNSYVIDLGEGNNGNTMNLACSNAATLAVTAGSGMDTLKGGPAGTSSTLDAGGGNDTVNPSVAFEPEGDDVIHGGAGDDRLSGSLGNDEVHGEGGNDKVLGGAGDDVEDGGADDDYIGFTAINTSGEDDQGADQLRGGDGYDQLFLDGHTGGMAISLDDQANDGAPGEGDDVGSDIEEVLGTVGHDVFTGTDEADRLDGFAGADEIHGAGGDDTLIGSDGDDTLFGDAGADTVEGRHGVDSVDGGAGADRLFGDIDGCTNSC
jgi:serralysin